MTGAIVWSESGFFCAKCRSSRRPQPVHVIAMDVRDEHVVDREEVERLLRFTRALGRCTIARLSKHAPVGVRAIDGEAEAVMLQEERMCDVLLAEGVTTPRTYNFTGKSWGLSRGCDQSVHARISRPGDMRACEASCTVRATKTVPHAQTQGPSTEGTLATWKTTATASLPPRPFSAPSCRRRRRWFPRRRCVPSAKRSLRSPPRGSVPRAEDDAWLRSHARKELSRPLIHA